MNVWLKLSDQVIMFGIGGVTRIALQEGYNQQTQKPITSTALYNIDNKLITEVNESVEEIGLMVGTVISVRASNFTKDDTHLSGSPRIL